MHRILTACCAWAASGHAAAPPMTFMNSRRRIARHRRRLAHRVIGAVSSRCPLWVKSRHVRRSKSCPLYPQ
jgi:hypothetical protein